MKFRVWLTVDAIDDSGKAYEACILPERLAECDTDDDAIRYMGQVLRKLEMESSNGKVDEADSNTARGIDNGPRLPGFD